MSNKNLKTKNIVLKKCFITHITVFVLYALPLRDDLSAIQDWTVTMNGV
jgi:hypothetical protein